MSLSLNGKQLDATTLRRLVFYVQIQRECKLDINVDEYVESTVRPFLMDVIYCWSKVGMTFMDQYFTILEIWSDHDSSLCCNCSFVSSI